jgi:NADPH:quinone reductase-like Zn-dependent oxidoreductase
MRQIVIVRHGPPEVLEPRETPDSVHAIDYRNADATVEVRRLTNGRGADVVLDPIGGRSFADSCRLLAPLGRLVMYGVSSMATGERRNWWSALTTVVRMLRFTPLRLMNRNVGVFGLNLGHLWDAQGAR